MRHACYWTMGLQVSTLDSTLDCIKRQQGFLQAAGSKKTKIAKQSIMTDTTLTPYLHVSIQPGESSVLVVPAAITAPERYIAHRPAALLRTPALLWRSPEAFPSDPRGLLSSVFRKLAREYPAPLSPFAHTWIRSSNGIGEYPTITRVPDGSIAVAACDIPPLHGMTITFVIIRPNR